MVLEPPHYLPSNLPRTSQHSLLLAMSAIPQKLALVEEGFSQEDVGSVVVVLMYGVAEANSRELARVEVVSRLDIIITIAEVEEGVLVVADASVGRITTSLKEIVMHP